MLLNNGAGPVTTLNVEGPTANIAPASGVDGIHFTSGGGDVTLNSNLGALEIVTTGGGIGIFAATTGAVRVTSEGNITTSGFLGDGILAGSNNANPVSISSTGNITTTGDNAYGIGAGAINGVVAITSVGNITTFGDGARGISAGSIDAAIAISSTGKISTTGAGASGISAANVSGAVRITSSGNITATGAGSNGIFASSIISDLLVTITSGSVTGGSASGVGVRFSSGSENLLTNYGTISALSGLAVSGDIGDETVNNYGTITGNVDLGSGANAFFNHAGALFNAGATATVGTFTNAGTLAPGGMGAILTTNFDGTFNQTSTGIFAIDLNAAAAASDRVVVGDTAVLAGAVAVSVLTLPPATAQVFTILQALGGVTDDGLALSASPALNASLFYPNATTVQLLTSVDFSTSGLNGNQSAIGDTLNAAFVAGGGGLTPVLLGLLNTPGLGAYKEALDELSPEPYSDAQIAALYASLGFSNSLLSCKVNGANTAAIVREGQCLWAGASAVFLDSGTNIQQIGFNETAGLFAAGAQVALDPVWRLGFAAGYQSSVIDTATNATSDGELAQGGVALKYNPGPLLVAGVVTGGHGWYDTQRPMAFGGFAATARSNSGIDILNGGLRVAYVLGSPQLYFKPMLDAAATRLHLGDFSESGGGAANLAVESSQQTIYTIAPTLEVGTEWWISNGTLIRPFLRGGATWYENGDLALSASFLGAPAGVSPFTIQTNMDDVMATVGAGIDVINGDDAVLHLTYDGQFGDTTEIHSVAIKGSARF